MGFVDDLRNRIKRQKLVGEKNSIERQIKKNLSENKNFRGNADYLGMLDSLRDSHRDIFDFDSEIMDKKYRELRAKSAKTGKQYKQVSNYFENSSNLISEYNSKDAIILKEMIVHCDSLVRHYMDVINGEKKEIEQNKRHIQYCNEKLKTTTSPFEKENIIRSIKEAEEKISINEQHIEFFQDRQQVYKEMKDNLSFQYQEAKSKEDFYKSNAETRRELNRQSKQESKGKSADKEGSQQKPGEPDSSKPLEKPDFNLSRSDKPLTASDFDIELSDNEKDLIKKAEEAFAQEEQGSKKGDVELDNAFSSNEDSSNKQPKTQGADAFSPEMREEMNRVLEEVKKEMQEEQASQTTSNEQEQPKRSLFETLRSSLKEELNRGEGFLSKVKGAKETLKEKIDLAADKIEEIHDSIQEAREEREIEKRIQKDPVGYYREIISFNAENISKVDPSKIPHDVYKELCIEAVSKNPMAYSGIVGPLRDDETICKVAKIAMTRKSSGQEQFDKMASDFPDSVKDFDANKFIESTGGDLKKSLSQLVEEDKAKANEESKKEDVENSQEQTQSEAIEETSTIKKSLSGVLRRGKEAASKLVDKIKGANKVKSELNESINEAEEIANQASPEEISTVAPEQSQEQGDAQHTGVKNSVSNALASGRSKLVQLFGTLVEKAKEVKEKLEASIEQAEIAVEQSSEKQESQEQKPTENAEQKEEPVSETPAKQTEQEPAKTGEATHVIGESVVEAMIDGAQIEQSNTETPSVEVPIVDMNVENVHVKGTPIIEAPIVEAPVIEVAAQEASVSQTPTEEVEQENTAPKTEAPEVETPSRETKRENIASETEVSSIEASKQESTKLKITAEEKETIKKEVIAELVALFGPNVLKKSNAKWLLRDGVQNRINKLMGEKAAQKRGESSAKQEQVNAEQETKNSENTTKREDPKIESVNEGQQNVVPPATENPNKEKPTVERVSREEILQATEPTVEAHVVEPGVQAKVEKVEIEPTVEAPTESVAQDGPPMILSDAMKNFYSAFGDLQKVVSSGSKNNGKASITKMMRNLENDYRLGKYNEQEFGDLQAFLELAAEEKTTNMQNKNVSGKEMMSKILNDKELEQLGIEMGKE